MKALLLLFCLASFTLYSQNNYEPSTTHPFGLPNPEGPEQIRDYHELIGMSDCSSLRRKPDGSWNPVEKLTWEFKYIMNGMGVQDQTMIENGGNAGSIRQFIADSNRWYVHYYSSKLPSSALPAWEGNKKEDKIILYRDQKAPNGMEGSYKITFYDIKDESFKWKGEWVDKTEKIVYPTWKIECVKRKNK
ncbi:MAG: hypothetical protein KJO77_11650 [Bacteroidia bacterium]|nr:hypothetical protein [Bacteroidia bacterium]NND53238.1 hypothetical protein [Flavobacteriaceae bacterium]